MVPTLNQWLKSFPIESRAKSFLPCRQDYPFPSLINRCGFHGLSMKKIGSKNHKKPTSSSPFFSCHFLSLSLSTFPASKALQPPTPPQEANTTTSRLPSSHYDSLSFSFSLSLSSTNLFLPLPTSDSGYHFLNLHLLSHWLNLLRVQITPRQALCYLYYLYGYKFKFEFKYVSYDLKYELSAKRNKLSAKLYENHL